MNSTLRPVQSYNFTTWEISVLSLSEDRHMKDYQHVNLCKKRWRAVTEEELNSQPVLRISVIIINVII